MNSLFILHVRLTESFPRMNTSQEGLKKSWFTSNPYFYDFIMITDWLWCSQIYIQLTKKIWSFVIAGAANWVSWVSHKAHQFFDKGSAISKYVRYLSVRPMVQKLWFIYFLVKIPIQWKWNLIFVIIYTISYSF